MELRIGRHWAENELEQYAMGTLPETRLEQLEEHLLVCGECQDRLVEMDGFIASIRSVAARFPGESVRPEKKSMAAGVGVTVAVAFLGSCI